MKTIRTSIALLGLCLTAGAQVQQRNVDLTNSTMVIPFPVTDIFPGTCRPGQVFTNLLGTWGANVYICDEAKTWHVLGGGGSGSTTTNGANGQALTSDGAGGFGTPVTLAPSALTNALNASNISSGNLSAARLPNSGGFAYNDTSKNAGVVGTISTGQAGTGTGAVNIIGSTSGSATLTVGAAAGTPTLTLPTASGTLARTSDNVATATALAANGTNCSAGNYPLGVDAAGNAEGCTAATGGSTYTGTANQVTVTGTVLSLPTVLNPPGSVTAVGVVAGSNISTSGVLPTGTAATTGVNFTAGAFNYDFSGASSVSLPAPWVKTTVPQTYTPGATQTFVPSATLPGLVISAGTPSSNVAGAYFVTPSGNAGYSDGTNYSLFPAIVGTGTTLPTAPTAGNLAKWSAGLNGFSLVDGGTAGSIPNGGTGFTSYTKGDLLCASGTSTLTKLGVGSNTNVLTADSTQTCGVKWAAGGGSVSNIFTSGGSVGAGPTSYTPSGTLEVYDATATTGTTQLKLRAGAADTGTDATLMPILNNAGTKIGGFGVTLNGSNSFFFYGGNPSVLDSSGSSAVAQFDGGNGGLKLGQYSLAFGSFIAGAGDVFVQRGAAGGITVGTASGGLDGTIQSGVTATNPGCSTTGHIGKLWFDTTTTTTVFKICMNVAGTVGWVTK